MGTRRLARRRAPAGCEGVRRAARRKRARLARPLIAGLVAPRARARLARPLIAGLVAVVGLAGCTAAGSGPVVSGGQLAVYISDPSGLRGDRQAQDVIDAERLAFTELRGRVRAFRLVLRVLQGARISDNARAAIEDSHAIAYLGEIVPGSSADSIGITNAQDLLQVSPTDTAVALTRSTAAVTGSPGRYYESLGTYGHTFARVVPTTDHEAVALVREMAVLGVRTLHVQDDGGDYGRALAAAVAAHRAGLSPAPSATADAVLYAGAPDGTARRALNAAAASDPHVKLFVPSALADPAFVDTLSPAAQRALYATSPGVLPSDLSPAAVSFLSRFSSVYGHPPAGEALFGFAAMQAVIDALAAAGSKASSRGTVVSELIGHRLADSVLGAYSIDKQGDTSFDTFVVERVRRGRLVAVRALAG